MDIVYIEKEYFIVAFHLNSSSPVMDHQFIYKVIVAMTPLLLLALIVPLFHWHPSCSQEQTIWKMKLIPAKVH